MKDLDRIRHFVERGAAAQKAVNDIIEGAQSVPASTLVAAVKGHIARTKARTQREIELSKKLGRLDNRPKK